MKNPDATTPRLACRIVRLHLSFSDLESGGGFSSRHIASCDSCKGFLSAARALEMSLSHAAKSERQTVPIGLDRRIVSAVFHTAAPGPKATFSFRGLTLGTVLALVIAAVVISRKAPELPPVPSQADIVRVARMSPDNGWTRLRPSADRLLDAAPLQAEADAVYSDARSAIGFLAMNFLPAAHPAATREREGAR
ncbi:MAG: hypothetical protein JWL59_3490 [Chthoniobacteraceae bacterium]|nr:hypothetical protein [Chthoniobacteraceae bacterium]